MIKMNQMKHGTLDFVSRLNAEIVVVRFFFPTSDSPPPVPRDNFVVSVSTGTVRLVQQKCYHSKKAVVAYDQLLRIW